MIRSIQAFSLLASLVIAQTALAIEVKPGDEFSGVEIVKVLSEKAYNLVDPYCIQKVIFQSPQHQAYIAVGSQLIKMNFSAPYVDPETGRTGFVIQATYFQVAQRVEQTFILGACTVQD